MSQGYQRSARLPVVTTRKRSYPVVVIGLATFSVAMGLVLIHRLGEQPVSPSTAAQNAASTAKEPVAVVASDDNSPKVPSRTSVAHRRVAATANSTEGTAGSTATETPVVVSAQAQGLISRMVQSAADPRTLTAQGAADWKQNLKALAAQGDSALPAIRQFLAKNQDVGFDGPASQALVGYPTLRAGLFDALAQIGGPNALQTLTDTLQTTADPTDIAALARILEQQAPGQYRSETLNAARETLDQIAKGQLTVSDVGPLFQVLQAYGDGNIASELAGVASKWPYYATMALALLPDGQGITALIQQLQTAEGGGSESRNLSLRMLAQVAAQYPDAASALLDQARQNLIPDRTWKQIATGLAGDQFQLTLDPALVAPGMSSLPGLKTYHMEAGNQNFLSLPVGENGQVAQRLDLINQLLSATSNPAAVAALQNARETLSGKTPGK